MLLVYVLRSINNDVMQFWLRNHHNLIASSLPSHFGETAERHSWLQQIADPKTLDVEETNCLPAQVGKDSGRLGSMINQLQRYLKSIERDALNVTF